MSREFSIEIPDPGPIFFGLGVGLLVVGAVAVLVGLTLAWMGFRKNTVHEVRFVQSGVDHHARVGPIGLTPGVSVQVGVEFHVSVNLEGPMTVDLRSAAGEYVQLTGTLDSAMDDPTIGRFVPSSAGPWQIHAVGSWFEGAAPLGASFFVREEKVVWDIAGILLLVAGALCMALGYSLLPS